MCLKEEEEKSKEKLQKSFVVLKPSANSEIKHKKRQKTKSHKNENKKM